MQVCRARCDLCNLCRAPSLAVPASPGRCMWRYLLLGLSCLPEASDTCLLSLLLPRPALPHSDLLPRCRGCPLPDDAGASSQMDDADLATPVPADVRVWKQLTVRSARASRLQSPAPVQALPLRQGEPPCLTPYVSGGCSTLSMMSAQAHSW